MLIIHFHEIELCPYINVSYLENYFFENIFITPQQTAVSLTVQESFMLTLSVSACPKSIY